jgi:hypothetical protein
MANNNAANSGSGGTATIINDDFRAQGLLQASRVVERIDVK